MIKRTVFFAMLLALAACADGKSADQDSKKSLDNDVQKASYLMGRNIAEQVKHSQLPINEGSFTWGLHDGFSGADAPLDSKDLMAAVTRLTDKLKTEAKARREAEASTNKKASEAFLAKNAKRKGVKVTKEGLQYEVIKAGDGPQPKADDTVKVNYVGKLVDGTKFDSSEQHGKPAMFPVNAVISGWGKALQMMHVGGKWKLYIPSGLAYGPGGTGPIGPNQALIFEVELLAIEHNKEK